MLRRCFNFFMDLIIKNKNFIFWLTVLNLTFAASYYFAGAENINIVYAGMAGFLRAAALALIIDLLIRIKLINKIIKCIFIFLSAVMFLVDVFALYYYKCRFDAGMLDVIFGTKPSEAGEFFEVYIFNSGLVKYFAAIFACIAVFYFIYLIISRKKIFWLIALITALTCNISGVINGDNELKGSGKQFLSPIRLFDMLRDVWREQKNFNEIISKAKNNVILTRNDGLIPYVIFILGESTAKSHMSLYGYKLDTTPLLNLRRDNGEIYVFNDVISPNAHTIPVMEKLFTFYEQGSSGKWFEYTSLFNILRSAGYKTAWLSNQETFGKYSRAGQFYASQDDISRFVMVKDSFTSMNLADYDGKLLPILDDTLKQAGTKNFYMLHIMATHAKYAMRYPDNFKKFTAHDEGGFDGISDAQKAVRADYDNAVLYNDFFVNEVIKRFEDKNAVIIYISDHGEEVYDTYNFAGHGDNNVSRSMIEIPMIIWTSQKFRENYHDLNLRIKSSVDRPFMTDDMIHVILDLMGIETAEYDKTKSVINDNFDVSRERIINGKIYDKSAGLN